MSRNLRPLFLLYGNMHGTSKYQSMVNEFKDSWRRGGKVMHTMTMPSAATSYQPFQVWKSHRLLYDLLQKHEKYESLFEWYAGALIMQLGYGKTVETGDEPHVRDILSRAQCWASGLAWSVFG